MILRYQIKGKHRRIDIIYHLLATIFSTLFVVIPCVSTAGGLYINEFGTPSMGVAGAGANAVASDASTSFHNPAGMTRIKGKEVMGTAGLLNAIVKFDPDEDTPISGGNGGDAGGPAPILGGFYVHSLSDRWKLGANLITLTGAILDYDNDWTGRYLNTDVKLLTVTFFPTVAYRVNDWLSLGGGPQIIYADLELKAKGPPPNGNGEVKIDGNDVAFGFGLGALVELSERTRFGVIYQSEIEAEFDGDVKFSQTGLEAVPIPRSHWRNLSRFPVITSSMTNGRCSGPWDGKIGAHLRISTFQPARAPKRFRATGMIPGSLPPASIFVRWKNGCCSLEFPTTPLRWILMIAHRICPLTVRFAMPPGFNISGATGYRPESSLCMPTTVRPK